MSHVDEGALHAYLDGALDEYPPAEADRIRSHLDGCPECAARLEVERGIRSDAEAMLGLAAPEVEVPSFEELRAYVQRTRSERRGISRLQRMGWAASVVLAIGAGWMLRDGQLQTRMLEVGQDRVLAPEEAAQDRDVGPAQNAVAEFDAAPAVRSAAAEETTSSSGGRQAVEGGSAARSAELRDEAEAEPAFADRRPADGAGTSVADAEAPAAPDPVDVVASADDRIAPASSVVAKRGLEQTEAGAPAEPAVIANIVPPDSGAAGGALPAAQTAQRPADVDALPDVDPSAAAPDAVAAEREAAEERSRTQSPAPVVSELGVSAGEAQRRADAAEINEAEDEAPEPLLAVPGHQVLDIENLGDGTTPWGSRARQRTADGRTFEVFHLEPGIDPSILPDLDGEVGEARVETEHGWVLVRGALSQAELDDLLVRLFPDGG